MIRLWVAARMYTTSHDKNTYQFETEVLAARREDTVAAAGATEPKRRTRWRTRTTHRPGVAKRSACQIPSAIVRRGFAPPTEKNLNAARQGTSSSFQRLRDDYIPGDLGFDPLGLKPEDPEEFRLMQEKELAHCRLAMIAAAGFLAQEAVSGETWGTFWGRADL